MKRMNGMRLGEVNYLQVLWLQSIAEELLESREAVREKPWTVREAADFLRWHPKTVYAKSKRGELPCIRQGRNLRFDPSDITRWQASRKE